MAVATPTVACWDEDEEDWWDWFFDMWGFDDEWAFYGDEDEDEYWWDDDPIDGGNYLDGDGAIVTPSDDDWWDDLYDDWWEDDWYDDDWWEDYEEDLFYYESWYQDYILQEDGSSYSYSEVQGTENQREVYTLQRTDSLIKPINTLNDWKDNCYKQVTNYYCVSTTIEFLCKFYGSNLNEGSIIMTIVSMGFSDYINSGFFGTVADLNGIFSNWFITESAEPPITCSLIDQGYPITANVIIDDTITHSVIIVGYDNDGYYICMDPLLGDFTKYSVSELGTSYLYKIKGLNSN